MFLNIIQAENQWLCCEILSTPQVYLKSFLFSPQFTQYKFFFLILYFHAFIELYYKAQYYLDSPSISCYNPHIWGYVWITRDFPLPRTRQLVLFLERIGTQEILAESK